MPACAVSACLPKGLIFRIHIFTLWKNGNKPEGYNSVSPYLVVDGAEKMIALLKQLFDARELRRYDAEDGRIVHSEVQVDDSVIMIADSNNQYPPAPALIHVYAAA